MEQTFWIGFLFGFIVTFFVCTKKLNKNKRLLLAFTITALLVSAPFVYCIITIKSPIGFIYPEQYDAWISFFGSIIGGILTVLGVWWTIEDHENTRRKDLATEYKPFLDFISYEKKLPKNSNYTTIEYKLENKFSEEIIVKFDKNKKLSTKIFSMKNIGRGVLSNICLDKVIIEDNYLSKMISFDNTTIGSIAPNQKIYLQIEIPPMMENEKEEKRVESKFKFVFTATDEFKYNDFSIELIFILLMERYQTPDYLLDGFTINNSYKIIEMETHFYDKKNNERIY